MDLATNFIAVASKTTALQGFLPGKCKKVWSMYMAMRMQGFQPSELVRELPEQAIRYMRMEK